MARNEPIPRDDVEALFRPLLGGSNSEWVVEEQYRIDALLRLAAGLPLS